MSFNLGSAHGEIVIDYNGAGVQQAMGDLNSLQQTGTNLIKAGAGLTAAGGLLGGGLVKTIDTAADFQQALDKTAVSFGLVQGASEETDAAYDALGQTIQDVASTTVFGSQEVAEAAQILGKSGATLDDIQGGLLQATTDFAAATDTSLPQAAGILSRTATQWGISGNEMIGVADDLTTVMNSTSLGSDDLLGGLANLAPMMKLLGADFADTGATMGFFKDQGLSAREVGTSLTAAMGAMIAPTKTQAAAMASAGIATEDFFRIGADGQREFIGWADTLDLLNTKLAGYDDISKAAFLTQFFGKEAFDALGLGILSDTDKLRDLTDEMNNNDGVARAQSEALTDNLRGALENLGGTFEKLQIAMGNPFLGPLQGAVEGVAGFVNALSEIDPAILAIVGQIAALGAAFLLISGGAITAVGAILRFGPAFLAAAAAAAPFLAILAAIGAAIGLGILAYKTDFLGFGTAVDKAMGRAGLAVDKFGKGFKAAFERGQAAGFNDVANSVQAFGDALLYATGIDITRFTDTLASGIQAFGTSMQNMLSGGVNPLVAGLFALDAAFTEMGLPEVGDAFGRLGQAAANFGAELAASSQEARDAGYSDLAASIIGFGDALDYVTGLPVEEFFRNVADAAQTFGDAFAAARADGLDPFSSALVALRDTMERVTGIPLGRFFDDLGEKIQGGADALGSFLGAIRAGDWDAAGQIIQNFSDAALAGIQNLADTIGASLQSIDLGEIAINIAGWVQGKWDDLKAWIQSQTGIDIDSIDIPAIAVNILSWVAGKIADLGDAIGAFLGLGGGTPQAGLGGTGVEGVTLESVAVNVSGWVAGTLESADALAAQIADWLHVQLEVSDEFVTMAGELGADIGQKVGTALANAIASGIQAVMTGGGGVPALRSLDTALASGAGFGADMGFSLGDAFANFDAQFTQAVEDALGPQFEQIQADLTAWIQEKITDLWAAIGDALDSLAGGTPQAGLGGTGAAPTLMQQLSDQIFEMFNTAATDIAARVATIDWTAIPKAVAKGIGDALANFGTALFGANEAQAAEGAEGFDPAAFGTKFGNQLVTAFQSEEFIGAVKSAVDQMPAATFQTIGTGILTKISNSISTAMQGAGEPGIGEGVGDTTTVGTGMGTALVTAIATGLQTAIDAAPAEAFATVGASLLTKVQSALSAAFTHVPSGGETGPVSEDAANMGTNLVSGLAAALAASISSAPVESFAQVGVALTSKIQEVLTTAMSSLGGTAAGGGSFRGGGGDASGMGTQIATAIASAISGADFSAVATALQTQLTTIITTTMTQVGTAIATGTAQWMAEFSTAFTNIQTVVTNGMTAVTNAVTTGMTSAQTAVTTTLSAITTAFTTFATAATTAGQTAGTGFSEGLTSGLAAAQGAAQAAVDAIIGILNSAADGAFAAGSAVGEGFASGMEASLGRVQAAASAMADAAAEGLAAAAQIASPSKVSAALGEQFGAGFALGIAGAGPNASEASFNIGQDAIRSLADSLRANAEAKASRIRGIGDSIRENQGLASGGGQPITVESTGDVMLDGEQMGTFTVETVLGGLIGAQRKGGRRRGRMS